MYIIIGVSIFIGVFYCLITEKIPGPWATMLGGLLMSLIGIINEEVAIESIAERMEILLFLIGMMIIVLIISKTGIFEWLSIVMSQSVKGSPFKILILLSILTAVASAFLDNVTTVLLMIPVSILISKLLKLDPFPFIMTEIMAANIGGVATLIGDPPQLIIGAEAKLGFNDFLINTAPISIISMFILLITVYLIYGKNMQVSKGDKEKIMSLDASRALKDKKLLKQGIVIFTLVILGLLFNFYLQKGIAIISLSGAIALVIISKKTPKEIFEEVEWDSIFFFIGLFMMIKGMENLKVIDYIGMKIVDASFGKTNVAAFLVLWSSAAASSLFGNIAISATFAKILSSVMHLFKDAGNSNVLWWALSFGTCLGGNISIFASVSNMIAIEASTKAGYKINFKQFLKFGSLISLETLLISSVYVWFRYL